MKKIDGRIKNLLGKEDLMKKLLAILLALVLGLSLIGCSELQMVEDVIEEISQLQEGNELPEDGEYTTKEDVALYLHLYGHLPENFITKKEAKALGWPGGDLTPYAPGKSIGGDHFGNYEGSLPEKEGRSYRECDIDTMNATRRGARRIIYSNDGLIYYTGDHYESFTLLYGEE